VPDLPISKSQINKLGDRLRGAARPSPADLDLLEAVLDAYGEALQMVAALLREQGFRPTDRLKTSGTIIDKLRRNRANLGTIQDLAGARVVLDANLDGQDRAVRDFCAELDRRSCGSQVIDRRADPRSGYRAVHVVARIDGIPVEVQFRTQLQDLWAQGFERIADVWGRDIRYDGEPDREGCSAGAWQLRRQLVSDFIGFSDDIAATAAQFLAEIVAFDAVNGEVMEGALGVGSKQGQVELNRRRVVEIVKKAFTSLAEVAEREAWHR
jgi:hypothetical protein